MDELTKEQYNVKAQAEEAGKLVSPTSKTELVNEALVKLQEHVCTVLTL